MKRFFLFLILFLFTGISFGQDLIIHEKDGTNTTFQISEIDSITFSLSFLPSDSLSAYYTFVDGNLTDLSSNGNNGSVIGNSPLKVQDRFNNSNRALSFSLQDTNFIRVQNSSSLNNFSKITISAWVKSAGSNASDNQTIVGKWNGATANQSWTLDFGTNNTKPMFGFRLSNESNVQVISNQNVAQNTWTHIVATYDGTTASLYLNGLLDNTTVVSSPTMIKSTTTTMTIGAHDEGITSDKNRFNGAIDDIRIYRRALSNTEIMALYHEGGW